MAEMNELAGGRYLIQEPLGEGGSGSIFRAWDQQLGRMVALKRIKENPSIEASIRHEAGILAALDHPNVVTVFDFGGDEGGHFVVMELLNGRTLEAIVQEQPLTVPKFLLLMNQICRGLAAAHAAGLVHCDIKPANIMLQLHRDGSFTTKVLDFGLATASVSTPIPDSDTGEGRVIQGSPLTISPEQLMGYPADVRSDIYAPGCTFYYALSGVYPHDAEEVSAIVQSHLYSTAKPLHRLKPDISEPLSIAVMKMLARDPNARPQDAEAVRLSLEGAARAPSAARRNVSTRGLPDYSRRPTGTITSTIPPPPAPPAVAPVVLRTPEQPEQYSEEPPQESAATISPGLRMQLIISCSSLLLIAVGAGVFLLSSKKAPVEDPAANKPSNAANILKMIESSEPAAPVATTSSQPTSSNSSYKPTPTPTPAPKPTATPAQRPASNIASGDKSSAPLIRADDRNALRANKGHFVKVKWGVGSFSDSPLLHARLFKLFGAPLMLSIPAQKLSVEESKALVGREIKAVGKLGDAPDSDVLTVESIQDIEITERPAH